MCSGGFADAIYWYGARGCELVYRKNGVRAGDVMDHIWTMTVKRRRQYTVGMTIVHQFPRTSEYKIEEKKIILAKHHLSRLIHF